MQILRQTVDLVSLYTLPLDPHRAPLRLTRPRRPHPHGRVDFVVLFFGVVMDNVVEVDVALVEIDVGFPFHVYVALDVALVQIYVAFALAFCFSALLFCLAGLVAPLFSFHVHVALVFFAFPLSVRFGA